MKTWGDDGFLASHERSLHCEFGITETIAAGIVAAGVSSAAAGTIAAVAVPAIAGAGLGAATAAATGGKPLQGALLGGVTGGVLGGAGPVLADATGLGLGASDALIGGGLGAAGSAVTGGNPLVGGLTGALGGYAMGSMGGTGSVDGMTGVNAVPGGDGSVDAGAWDTSTGSTATGGTSGSGSGAGASSSDPGGFGGTSSGDLNDWGQVQSSGGSLAASSGKAAAGGGAMNKTTLALGALSALGSLLTKPTQGTWQTPGPAQVAANLGPTYNQALNPNFPGRTAVNPMPNATPQSYYTYGANPEPTYFTNNSAAAYGLARGGALNEVMSGGRSKHVQGPGTGVSDSIPARLSNGEYILTADDVSRIGNPKNPGAPGANTRGAAILNRNRGALAQMVGQKQFAGKKAGSSINERSIQHYGRAA